MGTKGSGPRKIHGHGDPHRVVGHTAASLVTQMVALTSSGEDGSQNMANEAAMEARKRGFQAENPSREAPDTGKGVRKACRLRG